MSAEAEDGERPYRTPNPRGRRANPLSRIHVVLVEPQGPRNVGAVSRAMKNFGLSQLRLAGGVSKDAPEAIENAVGSKDILQAAIQVPRWDEALADLSFVVATTAKRRHRLPALTPREAAPRILEEASRGRVGLLFGREDHGLTGEELAAAHAVISIRTSPSARALNLSHAVALVAYEIFVASGTRAIAADSPPGRLVNGEVRRRLRGDLLAALRATGILKSGNEIQVEQSVDRLLALGPMQMRDARILFTLAKKVAGGSSKP